MFIIGGPGSISPGATIPGIGAIKPVHSEDKEQKLEEKNQAGKRLVQNHRNSDEEEFSKNNF